MVNFKKPLKRYTAFLVYSPQVGCWTSTNVLGIESQHVSFLLEDPREATGQRMVKYNKPMYIFNSNNAFRLKHSWLLELNSEFFSKAHYGNAQLQTNSWDLSFAVQKSWFKDDALTLRLSCSDIFRKTNLKAFLDLGNYSILETNVNGQDRTMYELQRLTLSLKYRFNSTKSRYKGQGAAGNVIERM